MMLAGDNRGDNGPFFLGATELTERQLHLIRFATGEWNPDEWTLPNKVKQLSCPIASWEEARALAHTLSRLDPDYDYRLPTEAEWEYACRGQRMAGKPGLGDEPVSQPHEPGFIVKAAPPNAFGLFDMLRNNGEFCSDWYSKDYYENSPLVDPQGPETGTTKVARGVRSEGRDRSYTCWERYPAPPEGDSNIQLGLRFVLVKENDNEAQQ